MNNDAWKAADIPASTSSDPTSASPEAAGGAPSPAETSSRGSISNSSSSSTSTNTNNRVARGAAKAGAKKAAARAAAAAVAGKSDAASAAGNICDTAPASPGSPATTTAVAVRGGPVVYSVASATTSQAKTEVSAARSFTADPVDHAAAAAIDAPLQPPPQRPQQQQQHSRASSSAAPAPWDEANSGGVIATDPTLDAAAGEGEEPLSDSLRLEPDFELEPGVDLKADLGLGEAASGLEQREAGVGAGMEEHDPLADGGNDATTARADDLGFEMIDRAEAVAAAVGAGSSAGGSSASVGGKGRKGWPWAWGRS